jgi:hypothetical protein
MITQARLKELLRYDPATGEWRRLQKRSQQPVGTTSGSGYRYILVDDRKYRASRLAWLYMTGAWPQVIDHRNGNTVDDRFENLREVTQFENCHNRKRASNNTSGVKGVCFVPARPGHHGCRAHWVAYIRVRNKRFHLGRFNSVEEAAAARRQAAEKEHGEFARHE